MAADSLKHPASPDIPNSKPVVVGIYGIPGSGKTFLLNKLTLELEDSGHFSFYEGSAMISSLVVGGLEAFQKLPEHDKTRYRQLAITTIGNECATTGRAAIITGHFMFWAEGEEAGKAVCTRGDLSTYTHIIYLGVPAEVIAQRRLDDSEKTRAARKTQLHRLCMDHGILFSVIGLGRSSDLVADVSALAHDFRVHTEEYNLCRAKSILDQALGTLAAADTGALFWRMVDKSRGSEGGDQLKELFSGPLGIHMPPFAKPVCCTKRYTATCTSATFAMPWRRNRWKHQSTSGRLLSLVGSLPFGRESWREQASAGSKPSAPDLSPPWSLMFTPFTTAMSLHSEIVLWTSTCYPRRIKPLSWSARIGLGARSWRRHCWMLSTTGGLRARQVLLPNNVSPRLDTTRLPLVDITDPEFIESVFRRPRCPSPQVLHATSKSAAKLLMTPTRNATIAGPALRDAHRRVGWYLAMEFLADLIGLEEYRIPHVQGHQTEGHRLVHEQRTLIVALMRGGEAMAFGVNDAFPLAMFVHAKRPEDILPDHVEQQHTVLLVDSFIQRVRDLHAGARIVSQAALVHDANLNIYTGRGTTDTGNRLFNTTDIA
ncbi:uracil phosphoribosyltransferase-domain-containing protein [Boletus edulis]|nr:uracil phosphoribosyltransferase-domain-containing protein [Boletus edulis]